MSTEVRSEQTAAAQTPDSVEHGEESQQDTAAVDTSAAPAADAEAKLWELLCCGNERVELSAAKELLALRQASAEAAEKAADDTLTVEIRVIGKNENV